jgi:hypothetical protein
LITQAFLGKETMAKHLLENNKLSNSEQRQIANLLIQFMIEMKEWELKYFEEYKNFNGRDLASYRLYEKSASHLNKISNKYCTPKKRKKTNLGAYGIPTSYDPKTEKILNVFKINRNRIEVFTQSPLCL